MKWEDKGLNEILTHEKFIPTGLTESEKQEFLDAVAFAFCPECGNEIIQNTKGRPKKFCSEACRFAWKNKHPQRANWKNITLICPICGQEFKAYGKKGALRKYCSRSCANQGRVKKKTEGSEADA